MFANLQHDWKRLKESEPGHRFQDRYYRRHREDNGLKKYHRAVIIGIGLLIIGVGVLLLLIPGPGWATIGLGAAFIAGESLILAKILDILEMVARKLVGKQRSGDRD